jgi:two-component system, OmpR family, response regulator
MKVLVVEDTPKVAASIVDALHTAGFACDVAVDGEDAWFKGSTESYAAIILDLGLPKMDGISVLKRWRGEEIKTPVLILSARGTWSERVDGIDSGADDYLPKPFEMAELTSRVKALIRRQSGHATTKISVGGLQLDTNSGNALLNGTQLRLTPLEFRLIHYLASNKDRVVPQTELAENIYDHNHERDPNAVEAAVSRLRRKLGNGYLHNKRGFGYFIAAS